MCAAPRSQQRNGHHYVRFINTGVTSVGAWVPIRVLGEPTAARTFIDAGGLIRSAVPTSTSGVHAASSAALPREGLRLAQLPAAGGCTVNWLDRIDVETDASAGGPWLELPAALRREDVLVLANDPFFEPLPSL